jgi:hypothetical protein
MKLGLYTILVLCFCLALSETSSAQNCLLIDCMDALIDSRDETYYKLKANGPQFYGVFANKTDTLVYDFVFKPYDGSCGTKLKVMLEETASGKIMFDSAYAVEDLKYLYLSKYAGYSDHLIIRLNLENHPSVYLNNPDVLFFKLKIEAIDDRGKSTLIYGKKGDKIFIFNNDPN